MWLLLNKNALYLMAPSKNAYLSKRSYDAKKTAAIPMDWFTQFKDPPKTFVVNMDAADPPALEDDIDEHIAGLGKIAELTRGRPYLTCKFSGEHDEHGFRLFNLTLHDGTGEPADRIKVISGSRAAQKRKLVHPARDFSGSGNPCPEGVYAIGRIIKMGSFEPGVGYVKIPIDTLKAYQTNNRSELLFHDDANRSTSRGSLGCLTTRISADMDKIVFWRSLDNPPELLFVDYGTGYLASKGIKL